MRKSKIKQDSLKTIVYNEPNQPMVITDNNLGTLLLAILLPMVIGIAAASLSHEGMQLYKTMAKPPLAPPSIVFPIVWTALYLMMGIASYLILKTEAADDKKVMANTLYLIQLVMNFFWPIVFFSLRLYTVALIWLAGMYAVVIACTVYFFIINRKAGWLMIPYCVWLGFAGYLNMAIAF